MGDYLRGKSYILTKETIDSYVPILRWIKQEAPRAKERRDVASILREMEGVADWKQVILSSREAKLLDFVMREFPEGSLLGKQLKLEGL